MERALRTCIMRSHDSACDACNTRYKDDATPAFALHCGHAQLRKQVCRATVYAPSILKSGNGNVVDGGNVGKRRCGAVVVDQDIGRTQQRDDVFVEFAHLGAVTCLLFYNLNKWIMANDTALCVSSADLWIGRGTISAYFIVVSQVSAVAHKLASERMHVLFLELLEQAQCSVLVAVVVQPNRTSHRRKKPADGGSDAARRARHERNLAGQRPF